jgi:hypothetical protein
VADHTGSGANLQLYSVFTELSQEVLGLLMRKVLEIDWTSSGTVPLMFEGDQILELFDDNLGYESYLIESPIGRIVVSCDRQCFSLPGFRPRAGRPDLSRSRFQRIVPTADQPSVMAETIRVQRCSRYLGIS